MTRFTLDGMMVGHPGPGPVMRMQAPATGPELIRCCRDRRGVGDEARPSVGALKLAAWIVADADRLAEQSGPWNPISYGERIERILAGETLPGDEFAEAIATMTDGAVSPAMFGEALPECDLAFLAVPAAAEPEEDAPGYPAYVCHGRLFSDLPSGPLFHAVTDRLHGGDFVLTGGGLAMRLTLGMAEAMRTALDDGIAFARDVKQLEGARA